MWHAGETGFAGSQVFALPCPALSCPALNMTKDSEAREMEQGQCVPEPDIRDSLRENRGCWKSAILKGWCDSV